MVLQSLSSAQTGLGQRRPPSVHASVVVSVSVCTGSSILCHTTCAYTRRVCSCGLIPRALDGWLRAAGRPLDSHPQGVDSVLIWPLMPCARLPARGLRWGAFTTSFLGYTATTFTWSQKKGFEFIVSIYLYFNHILLRKWERSHLHSAEGKLRHEDADKPTFLSDAVLCGLPSVELTSARRVPHDTPWRCVWTQTEVRVPPGGAGRHEGLELWPQTWEQRPRAPAWGGFRPGFAHQN